MSGLRVLVVGEEEYSPWQQVYSLLRRLPAGTVIVSDPTTRVGEMAKKACDGHELTHEPIELDGLLAAENEAEPVWSVPQPKPHFALFYHLGDEESPILGHFRAFAFHLLTLGVIVYQVRPNTYDVEAQAVVSLVQTYTEHGMPKR